MLAKLWSRLGCCGVLGGWVQGCRWVPGVRSRRSTPASTRPRRRRSGGGCWTSWSRQRAGRGRIPAGRWPPRPRTYGYDTLKLLIEVWTLAGQPSGKYLAATMGLWLPKLIEHGELDTARLNDHTQAQLLAVSGATIDRLLKPTRDAMRLTGLSGTKPGPLLRTSITVRKAGDEHERVPGFVEIDLVLHCGASLQGEFARTMTVTDVHTGWTGEHRAAQRGPPVGPRSDARDRGAAPVPADRARLRQRRRVHQPCPDRLGRRP